MFAYPTPYVGIMQGGLMSSVVVDSFDLTNNGMVSKIAIIKTTASVVSRICLLAFFIFVCDSDPTWLSL